MYKTKGPEGRLNLCGAKIARLRMALVPKCSQRALADKLELMGIDVNKNAVQSMEAGTRFVTDIELKALATLFGVTTDDLLSEL